MPSKKHMEWAANYVREAERFKRACYGTPRPTCGGAHNCRCKARARTVANALRKDA